jgi:FAD:protein FMN transferase
MQIRFPAMGSSFHINVVESDQAFLDTLKFRVASLEKLWSRFIKTSEINLLNSSSGSPVLVSKETVLLVNEMIRANRATEGAYNPTLLPALISVGYNKSLVSAAEQPQLTEFKVAGGSLSDIEINGEFVQLPASMTLDPGGIGKGLAADLIAAQIRSAGYDNFFVNAGGDLFADGHSPDGDAWVIGIENPFDIKQNVDEISFKKAGVATSSSLKKVFGEESHLLNPDSLSGKQSDIATCTVISGSATRSEVMAKVPFFHGLESSINFFAENKCEALIVLKDQSIVKTNGWDKYSC